VKNHEPTKHRVFAATAPASQANPGAVAVAKKVDPIANSQH
jgi:hypothetical protein